MTRQYQLGSTYLLSLGDGREYATVDAYVNEEAAAVGGNSVVGSAIIKTEDSGGGVFAPVTGL